MQQQALLLTHIGGAKHVDILHSQLCYLAALYLQSETLETNVKVYYL